MRALPQETGFPPPPSMNPQVPWASLNFIAGFLSCVGSLREIQGREFCISGCGACRSLWGYGGGGLYGCTPAQEEDASASPPHARQ